MILDKTRENNLLRKISFKIQKKICKKGLKYCKSARKRNKAKQVVKNILKGKAGTKYIGYKHINTGTSSWKSIRISEFRCVNSSTKYGKTLSF